MDQYSATPLTDDQRAEVLRIMSDCAAREQHNYRTHLVAERAACFSRARENPDRRDELHARAAGLDRALELLGVCWPTRTLEKELGV